MRTILSILAVLLCAGTQSALAQVQSKTTSAKEKDCRTAQKSKPKEEMAWVAQSCPGVGGFVVRVFDSDERQTVSYGKTLKAAEKEPAASESFGPFNHVGDAIEWRLRDGKPFATIVKWSIADNENMDKEGRPKDVDVLVVTRLAPACRVALVDVAANADAAALAQKAADEKAATFKCGTDTVAVIGKPGRGTALGAP